MFRFLFLYFLILNVATAQNISVRQIEALTSSDQGEFYFPKISPKGDKLFFTGKGYTGLYYMDLSDRKITKLNNAPGAGYEFCISQDGKNVYYRTSFYQGPRRFYSMVKQSVATGQEFDIEQDVRNLLPPQKSVSGEIMYVKDFKAEVVSPASGESSVAAPKGVYIDHRKIIMFDGQNEKTLEPLGPGIYIWPSLSPDGERMVFTLAGKGTYICDLNGAILAELGYANAPQWSPDGKWIVCMNDKDDGDVYTESEIVVLSSDGKKRFQITNSQDIIEMFPTWGADTSQLFFASNSGQLFEARLSIE